MVLAMSFRAVTFTCRRDDAAMDGRLAPGAPALLGCVNALHRNMPDVSCRIPAVVGWSSYSLPGGGETRRQDQGDRRGPYRIDGYTVELSFANGTVERRPFFIDDGGEGIWFRGGRLMREKQKPAQSR